MLGANNRTDVTVEEFESRIPYSASFFLPRDRAKPPAHSLWQVRRVGELREAAGKHDHQSKAFLLYPVGQELAVLGPRVLKSKTKTKKVWPWTKKEKTDCRRKISIF